MNSLPPSITVHSAKNSITDGKRIPRIPGEDAERGICGETAPPSGEEESFGGGGVDTCTLTGGGGGQTKTLKKVFSEICKTNPDMTNRDMTNIEVYRKKNLCHDCKCYCWTFNEQTLENKRHLIAVVSAIK